jgi:hypothetical protein
MRPQGLLDFCNALESTPMSLFIQKTSWVVPLVQIIHIFAIAVVLISSLTIYSSFFRAYDKQINLYKTVNSFKNYLYVSLIFLLLSGSVLIIGEPARSLANEAFQLKMIFLFTALICNFYLFKQIKNSQKISRVFCLFTMVMWLGVVFSGRWIAYYV